MYTLNMKRCKRSSQQDWYKLKIISLVSIEELDKVICPNLVEFWQQISLQIRTKCIYLLHKISEQ